MIHIGHPREVEEWWKCPVYLPEEETVHQRREVVHHLDGYLHHHAAIEAEEGCQDAVRDRIRIGTKGVSPVGSFMKGRIYCRRWWEMSNTTCLMSWTEAIDAHGSSKQVNGLDDHNHTVLR